MDRDRDRDRDRDGTFVLEAAVVPNPSLTLPC